MRKEIDKLMLEILLNAKGIEYVSVISPDDYLKKYFDETDNFDDVLKDIYQKILSLFPYQKEKLISYLISAYIKTNNDLDNEVMQFLDNFSDSESIKHFCDDFNFAKEIIKGYYLYLKNPSYDFPDEIKDLLFKYDKAYKETFTNDYIRYLASQILIKMDNNYASAATFILSTFYDNTRLVGDEKLLSLSNELKKYQNLLSRIVYADIYEDIMARPDAKLSNINVTQSVLLAVESKDYLLPLEDYAKAKNLLVYFLFLVSIKERRYQNRQALNENAIAHLKEINPLYMTDDNGIINTR